MKRGPSIGLLCLIKSERGLNRLMKRVLHGLKLKTQTISWWVLHDLKLKNQLIQRGSFMTLNWNECGKNEGSYNPKMDIEFWELKQPSNIHVGPGKVEEQKHQDVQLCCGQFEFEIPDHINHQFARFQKKENKLNRWRLKTQVCFE
jgi:hypothetical protein